MQAGLLLSTLLALSFQSGRGAESSQKNVIGQKVLALSKQCVLDNNLPQDKAKLAFSQDTPQDDRERCFLECCYRGLGIIQGEKFSLEGSMKIVELRFEAGGERAAAGQLVQACSKEVNATAAEKCSLGKAIRECFVKNGKEVNFFPSAL